MTFIQWLLYAILPLSIGALGILFGELFRARYMEMGPKAADALGGDGRSGFNLPSLRESPNKERSQFPPAS
jgi:hypothetical protein